MAVISTSDWSSEALPVTSIVPLEKLKSLTGMARGMPIWKSNNPEVFTLIDGQKSVRIRLKADEQ